MASLIDNDQSEEAVERRREEERLADEADNRKAEAEWKRGERTRAAQRRLAAYKAKRGGSAPRRKDSVSSQIDSLLDFSNWLK
jgi:hypothetical protein